MMLFDVTTSTVNSTSIEVSSALPLSSPSPWAAWPSPMYSSAPGCDTGRYTVTPSTTSFRSMLPPKRPESPVGNGAEPKPGATATQPSIGRSGTVKVGQVLARGLRRGHALLPIEMPADGLASIFHLHRELRSQRASDNRIVGNGVIAVQANAVEAHREHVAGHRALDEERPGLRVAAEDARRCPSRPRRPRRPSWCAPCRPARSSAPAWCATRTRARTTVGVNSWRFGGPGGRVGRRRALHFRVCGGGLSFSECTKVPDMVSPDTVPVYSSVLLSFLEVKWIRLPSMVPSTGDWPSVPVSFPPSAFKTSRSCAGVPYTSAVRSHEPATSDVPCA